jgi:hypothetical protein
MFRETSRPGRVGLGSFDAGIETSPEKFPWRRRAKISVGFLLERVPLTRADGSQAALFFGVKGPGDLKFEDAGAIDLIERRVMIIFGTAGAVHRGGGVFWEWEDERASGPGRPGGDTRRWRRGNSRAQIFLKVEEMPSRYIELEGVPQAGRS